MKKIKILISLLLIFILTVVPFLPILAVKAESIVVIGENVENKREDLIVNDVKITVSSVDSSDTFMAYKILDCFYDSNSNEVSYDFTTDFMMFLNSDSIKDLYLNFSIEDYFTLTSDDVSITNTSVITTSTLNTLLSKYATYVKQNNIMGSGLSTIGSEAIAEVEAGSYLIVSNGSISDYVYGVMVANATPVVEGDDWVIKDCIITAKKSESASDGQFIFIDFDLKFFRDNLTDIIMGNIPGDVYLEHANFPLNYEFIIDFISYIPVMPTNAINKQWKTELIYPKGLDINLAESCLLPNAISPVDFSGNNVLDSEGNIIATIEQDEIDQIENGENVKYNRLTITAVNFDNWREVQFAFGFSLNDDAVVGGLGNIIRKVVTYTDDPYVVDSVKSYESALTVYTYGIEVKSYGEKLEDDTYPLLKGGQYDVYSDEDLSNLIGSVVIDDNGEGLLKGLRSGTYYLKQTKASTGYQLMKDPIKIEVAIEGAVDGDNDGLYEVSIYNEKLWFLPSTGGIGTIIYTIVGLSIIGIASIFLVKYRKKTVNM